MRDECLRCLDVCGCRWVLQLVPHRPLLHVADAPFLSLSLPVLSRSFPLVVVQENRGYSPLHFAARFGAHRNALALLEKGAHPNMPAAVSHFTPNSCIFVIQCGPHRSPVIQSARVDDWVLRSCVHRSIDAI
jgi:hypothetical protein